jgi:hypothetical protein
MKQSAVEWLIQDVKANNAMEQETSKEEIKYDCKWWFTKGAAFGSKWQEQETIEEVFDWLTTNNYLTDLKETLIKDFNNFKKK